MDVERLLAGYLAHTQDCLVVCNGSGLVVIFSETAAATLPGIAKGMAVQLWLPDIRLDRNGLQQVDGPSGRQQCLVGTVDEYRSIRLLEESGQGVSGFSEASVLLREIHNLSLQLSQAGSLDDLYRMAVELGRSHLGFDRLGIFLYDPVTNSFTGTWGTDERGGTCDEHDYHSHVGIEANYIAECLRTRDYVAVWNDRALLQADRQVGRGWNAMAILWDNSMAMGWIAADNLLNHRPLTSFQRELLGLLGKTVSSQIMHRRLEDNLEASVKRKTAELQDSERHYRELYEVVTAQNNLKERLFTILAHDLRGPLGTARNLLGLIDDDPAAMSLEEIRETVPEIRRSLDSTFNLLENLLYWVRSQMQEITVLRERVDVIKIIRTLAGWLDRTILVKGLGLDVQCPSNLTVDTDERMVETILRNFLTNAVKFSQRGGVITLAAVYSEAAGEVRLSVTDQGVGMNREQVQKLFSGFISGSVGTSGERGSGLGLLFCRDMATKLGARIEVSSTVGIGSTFTLVLPDRVEGELEADPDD
jgi:signal transduction histidine kinase